MLLITVIMMISFTNRQDALMIEKRIEKINKQIK